MKLTRKVTLQSDTDWVQLQIQVRCYDDAQIVLGKSKLRVELPGSCAF